MEADLWDAPLTLRDLVKATRKVVIFWSSHFHLPFFLLSQFYKNCQGFVYWLVIFQKKKKKIIILHILIHMWCFDKLLRTFLITLEYISFDSILV